MIIERVYIESFGALKDLDLSFDRGINILEGGNESGKSSVAAFVRFMFYGTVASDRPAQAAGGSLELSCENGRYRIERRYNGRAKGLPEEELTIIDLKKNVPIRGTDPAYLFLGVPAELFDRSSFMAQLDRRAVTGEHLSLAVENMLSSADESISAGNSAKQLSRRLAELEGEDGEIASCDARAKDLSKRLTKAQNDEEEQKRLTESLADNRRKVGSNRKDLEESTKIFEHTQRKMRLDRLKTAGAALKKKTDAETRMTQLRIEYTCDGYCPDGAYQREAGDLCDRLKRSAEAREAAEAGKTEAQKGLDLLPELPKGKKGKVFEAIEECRKKEQKNKNVLFLCLGAALLLLIAGVLLFVFSKTLWGVICTVAAVAALGAGGLFFTRVRAAKAEKTALYGSVGAQSGEELSEALEKYAALSSERATLEKQIDDCEKRAEKERETTAKLLDRANALAGRWGKTVEKKEDLYAIFEDCTRFLADCSAAQTEAENAAAIVDAAGETCSEEELRALLEKQRTDGVTVELSPEEYKHTQMKINFYTQTIDGLNRRIETQSEQLQKLEASMEDSEALKEECENCRRQGEALREEAFVTRAARDAILETIAYMRAAILPAVLNGASAFLERSTGGKYVRFSADADYNLQVVDGDGRSHAPGTLSGGTAELCCIALRLGIAGRLYPEPCMPYFFDESFAHFDDLRKASAFMAIADLAAQNKGQFFILSCHKRDAALFEKICPIRRIAIE